MKKFKKQIALILALAVVPVCLSGCAKEGKEANGDKKFTISWAANVTDPNNLPMAKYYEDALDMDLDVWAIPNEEALNLRFASGEIPDVFSLASFASFEKYNKQRILAEIPMDKFSEKAPELLKVYQEQYPFEPAALEYMKFDGKLMGLPGLNYDTKFRTAIAYRGDWMEKVGVEKTPETLEEFENLMYKFTNEDPDGNGKNDTYGISQSGMNVVYGAFGFQVGGFANVEDTWIKDGDSIVFGPVVPEAKNALAILQKWYSDGVLDPEFITGENTGGYWPVSHSFMNNRIGCTTRGAFYHYRPEFKGAEAGGPVYLEFKKVNPEAADAMRMGVPPVGPTGKRGIFKWNMLTLGTGISRNVEKEPGKLEKILEFMNYTVKDYESTVTAHYGIEGEHWTAEGNEYGIPKMLNDYKYEDIGAGGTFLTVIPPSFKEKLKYPEYLDWTYKNEFDKYGINNELMTALPSGGQYTTELKKLQEEAYLEIITGKKPVEYFDEFVKNWYASGGEQLTKEANEWYGALNK